MKIALLGGGNMARAIVLALLKNKVAKPAEILVIDPNADKRAFFARKKVHISADDYSLIQNYDVLFLAVKPQSMSELLAMIRDHVALKSLVISIAAGIRLKALQKYLRNSKIIRAMPNTPVQIQQGVIGWTTNRRVTPQEKRFVQKLLESLGVAFYVSREDHIDIFTALSASGAGYVFYFMEPLIRAAVDLGMNKKIAHLVAVQTFLGSTLLLQSSGESPAVLRQKVTSKKGTTQAALEYMERCGVAKALAQAVHKAYQRSKELNF